MFLTRFVHFFHHWSSVPRLYRVAGKCLISAVLLWVALHAVSVDELRSTFTSVAFYPIIAALLLKYVNMLIMTGKWYVVLPEHPRFSALLSVYWASDFMGLFSVGILGTELFKGMIAQRKPQVVASSLFDRALAMMLYVVLCGMLSAVLLAPSLSFKILGIAAAVSVYSGVLWLLVRGASAVTMWYGKRLTLSPLLLHGLFSASSIVITTLNHWFIFYSLGLSLPWSTIFLFSVVLIIGLALPITIQGIGVREWVYVTAAPLLLISPTLALSAAWVHYLLDLIYKSTGAIPFLTKQHRL